MSSLKDLASLIMIPSLYKDGRLDTVKPLGNSIIHPDATGNNDGTDGTTPPEGNFTFSRGSNLAATRVDVNGLIEKGRENLLLRSNEFDNAYWSKSDSSIVTGQADPNGGSNAFKVVENTNTAYHRIFGNYTMVNGNVYTTSVIAKAAGRNYLTLSNNVSAGTCIFNLTNGSVSLQESSVISASATSLGGGWYRCEMVAAGDKSGTYNVFIGCDDDGVIAPYTGDGTSGVFIYQSQLELGLVATDYIETGASTAQAGILEDMPRLDYSGGASCPSLLLEPQRSNLIRSGEYFGDWTLQGGGTGSTPVLEANTNDTLSPQGKYNAYKVTLDAGSGTTTSDESIMYISKSGLTSGSNHTASVYLKGAVGGEEVIVRDTEGSYKKWTLTTEWARYDYTQVAAAPSYATSFGIRQGVAGTINSDAVVYMFGFQSELGSYPTSYIPTYGSSVTRSKDVCINTNASGVINSTQGVLFIEGKVEEDGGFAVSTFSISDGTDSNRLSILQYRSSPLIRASMNVGGVSQFDIQIGGQTRGLYYKIAAVYSENNCSLFINGVKIGNDTSATMPSLNTFNKIGFVIANDNYHYEGNVKQALYFPTALTDSECIALTTL